MKRILATCCLFLAGIPIAAGFSGCKSGEDYNPDKANIEVAMLASERKTFEAVEDLYEKENPGVNIVIKTYTDYTGQMNNYVKNGWPHIVFTAGDQHAGYSGAGHFIDLKTLDEKDDSWSFEESDIYDVLLESTHFSPTDTGYWFMPRDYNIPTIFVNKKHFEYAGIDFEEVKKNWGVEKFLEVCETLKAAYATADDGDLNNLQAGFLPTAYPLELDAVNPANFQGILESWGGKNLDTTKSTVEEICSFTSDASVAAYVKFQNTFYGNNQYCDPTDTHSCLFNAKQAAMLLAVRPSVAAIPRDIDYDFLPNPFPVAGVGCGGYAITKQAEEDTFEGKKYTDYCWDFLKFLVSKEGQNALSSTGLVTPAIESLAEEGIWMNYGDTETLKHNHRAFTTGYTETKENGGMGGETIPLNDAKIFEPAAAYDIKEGLNSLVSFCIQQPVDGFEAKFREKTVEVLNKFKKFNIVGSK